MYFSLVLFFSSLWSVVRALKMIDPLWWPALAQINNHKSVLMKIKSLSMQFVAAGIWDILVHKFDPAKFKVQISTCGYKGYCGWVCCFMFGFFLFRTSGCVSCWEHSYRASIKTLRAIRDCIRPEQATEMKTIIFFSCPAVDSNKNPGILRKNVLTCGWRYATKCAGVAVLLPTFL